jgi:nucleoside-diphosphate-sugar epimerase
MALGYEVTVLDNLSTGVRAHLPEEGFTFWELDDRAPEARERIVGGILMRSSIWLVRRWSMRRSATRILMYANTAYNLSTQTETSLNDLVAIFGKAVGRELHPAHEAAREGDIYCSMLANEKAKTLMGWQPEVSLEEGLRRTVAYFASAEL